LVAKRGPAPRVPAKPKNPAGYKKPRFLKAFRATCSVTESARIVGIDRRTHYDWQKSDPKYAAAFQAELEDAMQCLEDDMVAWARVGVFEPNIFQGRFQYASRKRVMCLLADGTSAFADELPKGAKVMQRRTVTTNDGEMLGVWRRSEGMMGRLAAAWLPQKYGTLRTEHTGKDGAPLVPEKFTVTFVRPKPEPDQDELGNTGGL
jgi:hypothetical protein